MTFASSVGLLPSTTDLAHRATHPPMLAFGYTMIDSANDASGEVCCMDVAQRVASGSGPGLPAERITRGTAQDLDVLGA